MLATVVDGVYKYPRRPADDWRVHASFWVLVIVAMLIGYGVMTYPHQGERVLQIVFAVAVLPPLVIGLIAAALCRQQGKPLSLGTKTILLVGISGISIPLAAAVFVYAIIVAIQQTCFTGH